MKSVVANWERILYCVRIETLNGTILRFAQYPYDVKMSNGEAYKSDYGYEYTGFDSGTSFSPSSVDLSSFLGAGGITLDQIASGLFDNAKVYVFCTDWAAPIEDEEELNKCLFGKTALVDDRYQSELMFLIDALNQTVGETYSPLCKKPFGGQEYAGCGIDISIYTFSGTITDVTDPYNFVDSGRGEEDNYFVPGTVVFTSGDNSGLKLKQIKSFSSGGLIGLLEAFHYPVNVGDEYSIVKVCGQRLEDCKFFDNVINSGVFSFIPTQDQANSRGTK